MFLLILLMNLRCADGLPAECSYDCGRVYTGFLRDCGDMVSMTLAHNSPHDPEGAMAPYTAFNEVCAAQDPLSLVRAIDAAHCWSCGDERLDAEHGARRGLRASPVAAYHPLLCGLLVCIAVYSPWLYGLFIAMDSPHRYT